MIRAMTLLFEKKTYLHVRKRGTMSSPVLLGNITLYIQLGTVPEEYQIAEEWKLTYLEDLDMHYPSPEGSRT